MLLSDGESTVAAIPSASPRRPGQRGVAVHTVALGTESAVVEGPLGEQLPCRTRPRDAEAQMSEVSGGQAFTATESDQLDNVYEKLGSKIGQKQEKREMTAGFAGAGALLLLAAAAAAMRMGGRLP